MFQTTSRVTHNIRYDAKFAVKHFFLKFKVYYNFCLLKVVSDFFARWWIVLLCLPLIGNMDVKYYIVCQMKRHDTKGYSPNFVKHKFITVSNDRCANKIYKEFGLEISVSLE